MKAASSGVMRSGQGRVSAAQRSRELLILLRLSSLFRPGVSSLSPMVVRRVELFIAKKDLSQAGSLADFMTDIVEATFEEKLRILGTLDLGLRLERVLELLTKQISGIKGNVRITAITTTVPPNTGLDLNDLDQVQRDALAKRALSGMMPPGIGGASGGNDEENEVNEVEELKQKLVEAGLSPEAQKVAERELKRLKKMKNRWKIWRSNHARHVCELPASRPDSIRLEKKSPKQPVKIYFPQLPISTNDAQ